MTIKQKFKKLSLCTSALCLCTTWGYGAAEVSWTNLDTAMGNLTNLTLAAPSNITGYGVYLVDNAWTGSTAAIVTQGVSGLPVTVNLQGAAVSATKIIIGGDTTTYISPHTLFVSSNWSWSAATGTDAARAILTDATLNTNINAVATTTPIILYSSAGGGYSATHFARLYWNGATSQYQSTVPTVSLKDSQSTRSVDVFVDATSGASLNINQYFNNATSYSATVNAGVNLPAGISLNASNQIAIENTYTWTSNSLALSITANGANSSTARLDLNLNLSQSQPAAVTLKTIGDQKPTVGTAITSLTLSEYFTNVYTNTTYSIAPPINGLSVAGGELSGTPTTAAAAQSVTITATNPYAPTNQQTATQPFNLTVYAESPTRLTIDPVQTATVNSVFSLSLFTNVYTNTTYSIAPPINGLSVAGGELSGTPTTAAAAQSVTITATNPYAPTDQQTATQPFNLTVYAESPTPKDTISAQTATVGTDFSLPSISTYFTNVDSSTGYSITDSSGTTITIPGLSIENGILSGAPTAAGTYSVTIKATKTGAAQTATQPFNLTVNAESPTPKDTISAQTATVGTDFSLPSISTYFTNVDTNTTYSITDSSGTTITIPGLSITNGRLSGTPTAAGTYRVTIKATKTGAAQTATQTFTLTVYAIPPARKGTISAQTAIVNQEMTYLTLSDYFTNVDTNTGYSITDSSGTTITIPGLSITNGRLSGKPTAEGTYSGTLTATNPYAPTNQKTATQTFYLTVTSLIVSQAFGDPFQNLMTRLNAGSITDVTQLGFFHYTPIPK